MDDVEEGVLDESGNVTQTFHEMSSVFPEHGWKELARHISEVDRSQESQEAISRKDWDQYLSSLSLNDTSKFLEPEIHVSEDLLSTAQKNPTLAPSKEAWSNQSRSDGQDIMRCDSAPGGHNFQADFRSEDFRASSAPLWCSNDISKQLDKVIILPVDFQNEKCSFNQNEKLGSSLEEKKLSGSDQNIPCKTFLKDGPVRKLTGSNVESDIPRASFLNEADLPWSEDKKSLDRETASEDEPGEKSVSFHHSGGDGTHVENSSDVVEHRFDSSSTKMKESVIDRKDVESSAEENQGLLGDLKTPDEIIPNDEISSNIVPSREAAENLPERPLTIGDSLTRGAQVTYRPVSPFQLDTSRTASLIPTTSVALSSISTAHYSKGVPENEDMSARERLQPLGRDGLEVKQGPPWGATMPLFQPDSSSSSNDSNLTSGSHHFFPQPEPQQFILSKTSEIDLSRKTSVKSLEPKEPMGVKIMNTAVKTPVGKLRQQHLNNLEGDSPVSKILGPTFKVTQKMLEELQRRPLEEYHEGLATDDASVEHLINTREIGLSSVNIRDENKGSVGLVNNSHENRSSSLNQESTHPLPSKENIEQPTSSYEMSMTRYSTPVTEEVHVSSVNNDYSSAADADQKITDGRPSSRSNEKLAWSSEYSMNHRTPNLVAAVTTADMEHAPSKHGGIRRVLESRPSSRNNERQAQSMANEFSTDELTPGFATMTTADVGVTSSYLVGVQRVLDGRIPTRNKEKPAWSSSFDNTTKNHVTDLADVSKSSVISLKHATSLQHLGIESHSLSLSGQLASSQIKEGTEENGDKDRSNMIEFDRITSTGIAWSNAEVNEFREEIKESHNLQDKFQEKTLGYVSVAPVLDSGLSESTTNDEIYRPKRLSRLSTNNGPVGVYDVRQSSGPGSTNRKRLALGCKPRDISRSELIRETYLSDETNGTSETDRSSKSGQDCGIYRSIYVSEGTTTGTDGVGEGIDSEPEGQSTPKSEDTSPRETTSSGQIMKGIYLHEKPTRDPRSRFTTYQTPSVPIKYQSEAISKSSFEIHRKGYSNHTVENRSGSGGNSLGVSLKDAVRSAKVEHTWSVSSPVMSQLSTKTSPSVMSEGGREMKGQKETTHAHQPRHKDTLKTQQSSDDVSSSDRPFQKKKSVADIILHNMIHDEEEQKKRRKKLAIKQVQVTQDLNQLWERFQQMVGKKSRHSRKTNQFMRPSPDISDVSSSSERSSRKTGFLDVSTDSDEEFEKFLRRIREIQSSESTSHLEDTGSTTSLSNMTSQSSLTSQIMTSRERRPEKKVGDCSISMTAESRKGDRSQEVSGVRRSRRAHQNIGSPAVVSRSASNDMSMPMWLSAQNKGAKKKEELSFSCTCGAKARKLETTKSSRSRDIGVNCPTPPIPGQEMLPLGTDLAVLKSGPSQENPPSLVPVSLMKLTLQDAFENSKQDFIARSRARVEKLKEKRFETKRQENSSPIVVVTPSGDKKFVKTPEKKTALNVKANKQHESVSEQLLRKKPRPMTSKEIRDVNKRLYKKLPEVRKKNYEKRREELFKTNRLRAQLYGKHVRNRNRVCT